MPRPPLVVWVLVAGIGAPAAAENLPAPLAPIVAAERSFAQRCGVVGIRASFLEFFAPNGVSFAPEPGLARPRLEARPAPKELPPISLEWGPEQAEVAPGGDLGWTTGPSRFTDKTGKNPPHNGYYFSLWRMQPDGTFKVELDMGTETPPKAIPVSATAVGPTGTTPPRAPAGPDDVKKRDEEFCKQAEGGAGKAYAAALAANARVHREKAAPVVGDKQWRPWAKALAGVMSCAPSGAAASAAPGLGYTYGSYQLRDKPGGAVVANGFYTRVWRREGGEWQIAVDVASVAE